MAATCETNPKLSGTKHNVFGIQTGVAISFMVKRTKAQGLPHFLRAPTRIRDCGRKACVSWINAKLREHRASMRSDQTQNTIGSISRRTISIRCSQSRQRNQSEPRSTARRRLSSSCSRSGVVTNRDEWVYDDTREKSLATKINVTSVKHMKPKLTVEVRWKTATADFVNRSSSGHSELETHLRTRYTPLVFDAECIVSQCIDRFVTRFTYYRSIYHSPFLPANRSLFPVWIQERGYCLR